MVMKKQAFIDKAAELHRKHLTLPAVAHTAFRNGLGIGFDAGYADASAELERLRTQYNELIMAVSMKWEGETRHETALRYIRQAECSTDQTGTMVADQTAEGGE